MTRPILTTGRWRPAAAALLWMAATGAALAQPAARMGNEDPMHPCGMIFKDITGYGPFDYRNQRDKLTIVEIHHFTSKVEQLLGGQSGGLGADLDYTLRAFPNHHRALVAVSRWEELRGLPQGDGMNWPVQCYFDRAIRFAPDDVIARALYAQYLHKKGRTNDARAQLELAVKLVQDSPLTLHNLGLVYLEIGDPATALRLAHEAYAQGLVRDDLKRALQRAGQWREAPPPAPAAAATDTPAPAAQATPGASVATTAAPASAPAAADKQAAR